MIGDDTMNMYTEEDYEYVKDAWDWEHLGSNELYDERREECRLFRKRCLKEREALRRYNRLMNDKNMSSSEIIDIVNSLSRGNLQDCLIEVLKHQKEIERRYENIKKIEDSYKKVLESLKDRYQKEIEELKLEHQKEIEEIKNIKLTHQKEIDEIKDRKKEENKENKERAENYKNLYTKSLLENVEIRKENKLKDIQIKELTEERDIYKKVTDKINKKDLNQELNRSGKGLAFKEDASLSKVKELMLKGYKPKEIKDELNCSLATIYNRIKEIKEVERDIEKEENNKEVEINSEDETIESLYGKGYKVKEIVKMLGVSQATVYRKVKEIKDKRAVRIESDTERDT